jgi:Domain of Unknown Function (DUF1080)
MFRTVLMLLVIASLGWCANGLTHKERKEGFELLFDGRTLDHWHSIKQAPDAGSWRVRKGILTWDKGGSWLSTDETFYDFVLRLDYRTGPASDSGIFLRSAEADNPAFSGMKLAILGDAGKPAGEHSTGALYGAAAQSKNVAKPNGEWNHVEVSLIKRELSAIWNGERILDVNLDDRKYENAQGRPLAERLIDGHIGLQAHSAGAPGEFRNIRIRVVKAGQRFK